MGFSTVIRLTSPGLFASAAALALFAASSALGQRPQPSPEQRIERLERQVQQMQRQVFPKGRPADTAGFPDDPAASQSSVATIAQRLDSLERQMSDLLRQSEENNHLVQTLQSELAKARTDTDSRIGELERRLAEGVPAAPAVTVPTTTSPPKPKPVATPSTEAESPGATLTDAGEEAYTRGFKLWEAGEYDSAITALKQFTAAYPKHRRVSYANNLIGRALLDKGETRKATQVLLANYRQNPKGERAPDSLYYLGQALEKLGQPGQACKVYAELDDVYGSKMRADLKKLATEAKAGARC